MRPTRRSLFQLPLIAVVAGCTNDPTIRGNPGSVPEPVAPTRSAGAAAVAAWVEGFAAVVDAVAGSAAAWGADDVHVAWVAALQAQCAAHLSRVVAADPVTGGSTAFPVPSEPPAAAPLPTTPVEALATITAAVSTGAPVLHDAVVAGTSAQERLFHASVASAATASLSPALPPADGGVEPAPFDGPDLPGALGIALSHVWALINALELGLGRLSRSDALQVAGTQRLDSARVLRNSLLAALPGEPPAVQTWALPNAMSTAAEIRAAWGVLETRVLDGLGVAVSAEDGGSAEWLEAMLGQVAWVHRWGGRLPYWPGWVATS